MKQLNVFTISLLATLFLTRLMLHLLPFTHDLNNFGPYNIRHIFVGGLLLIFAVILLLTGKNNNSIAFIAGIGSAWIIDEIIYLIATAGDYLGYVGMTSFGGMMLLTVLVLFVIWVLGRKPHQKK